MDISLYWALEYIKVLLGYMFIMFIWPSVVFRRFFRGKSLIFHFSCCTVLQVVLINTVVLLLGLFHILDPWVFKALFYGSFLLSAFRNVRISKKDLKTVRYLLTGTFGFRQFLFKVTTKIGKKGEQIIQIIRNKMHSHWWECGLLGIIVVFGMMYFSHGAFQDYSYGFSDMYVHHAWIYFLTQGKIFSSGVYPEAMHCFVYSLHVLFGIRLYSCMMFVGCIHVAVYLLSAYVLMREVFRWRYSPMLALTLFLTVDLLSVNEVSGMARMQSTLPQEFGLFTMYLCAAFLVRYLRSENRITRKGKLSKKYWDENLLIFSLALAASLAIHFYDTIMAFFMCVSFVPVLIIRIFSRKRFTPLLTAVLCGVLIAVIPMGGALLSGIRFEGSINWALSIINSGNSEQAGISSPSGDGEGQTSEGQEGAGENNEGTGENDASTVEDPSGMGFTDQNMGATDQSVSTTKQEQPSFFETFADRIQGLITGLGNRLKGVLQTVWKSSYLVLFGRKRATWLAAFSVLAIGLWLISRFMILVIDLISKKKHIPGNYFDHYVSITLASFIFMFMYSAKHIGLPPLVEESRLCSTGQMMNLIMLVVPFDLLFHVFSLVVPQGIMKFASAICVVGIYVGTILTDTFHGHLYIMFTRYNEAVMTTESIIQTLPEGSYTIVSTVDEVYQIIQYGWHEELVNFVNESVTDDYTLPTRYVFIYIEKRPLLYAQSHFFEGPAWMASEKYSDYLSINVSQCPDIASSVISDGYTMDPTETYSLSSAVYSDIFYRTVLESKMYKWCEQFQRMYPNELKVYYETDNFVCYYFEQNVQRLYQLAIMPSGGGQ